MTINRRSFLGWLGIAPLAKYLKPEPVREAVSSKPIEIPPVLRVRRYDTATYIPALPDYSIYDRQVADALHIPYEELQRDFTRVSYSFVDADEEPS
jgi:hypothetical protein